MAAKKADAKKPITKTAFVQSFPRSMSAKEIVEAGKKQGIKLTPKLVYVYRSPKKKKAGGAPSSSARTVSHHTQHSVALRAVILDVGYERAAELLKAERERLLRG